MSRLPREVQERLRRRWRIRLAVAIGFLAAGALVATIISLAYAESWLTPVLLWAGVLAIVQGRATLPEEAGVDRRGSMISAGWIVAGIVLYVVIPLLLNR